MDLKKYINLIQEQNEMWNNIPSKYYTDYGVKRGLRNPDGTGVLAGVTGIGEVHGYIIDDGVKTAVPGKLRYRGIDVEDIIEGCRADGRFGYEEVVFLLLFGFLPDKQLLGDFKKLLARKMPLPGSFSQDMILAAPSPNIMNKLARSVLALYSYDKTPDSLEIENLLEQSLNLIAHMPMIIAHAYYTKRNCFDKESLILHSPDPDLSMAENFLQMIRPDKKFTPEEAEVIDLLMIIQAEHGGGNNSAFALRVVSSSDTDTYSAIAAAIGSLKGPKHGGANHKMMEMMEEIKANVKDWADEGEIYAYLKKILSKEAGDGTGLIYGMGHAVYTVSDPRTALVKDRAGKLAAKTGFEAEFKLYGAVERIALQVLTEAKGKGVCANVDFYSGLVYQMLGISEELYTPIFAMARIAGWCAHRIEEVLTGKRIIRPAYKSIVKRREYTPLGERHTQELNFLTK